MKQKRKVKSLLPQEGLINGRFWTILLVVLSLILCVGSVSLLTHSVRAVDDEQYVIRYTDGVDGEEVFSDEVFNMLLGQPTPSYLGDTTRTNYVFVGWNPTVAGTVSGNATYEAQWKEDRNNNGIPDEDEYRTITYNDGVNDEVVFADQKHENQLDGFHTPQYNGDKKRTNYVFVGWNPTVAGTVSGNATYKAQWKEDRNNNGIPDDQDIQYKLTINYLYTGSNEIAIGPYVLYGLLSGLEYTVNSPQIQYYYADKESVTVMIRGQDVEETVRYKPENDWNNNDIADQDENLQPINDFEFDSPVDNVQEVLYGMQFIDPLDVQKIVNNLYISGSNFYITPNPVILSGNTVDAGLYSHVLGGERNGVYSKNITLIAGGDNIINDGNENASILGGDGNQVRNGDGIPAILVGGENNIMKTGHSGNALIGGKGNSIEGGSNDFILGGEDNVIDLYSENVILGGKKIHIEDKNNIFVYSNFNYYLYPQSQNAFYLNMLSGVGINTGSSGIKGLSVGGAVSFGDVNISLPCVGGNLGVKGTYSGCLVGCTEKGKDNGGKWEMLDLGDKCAHLCTGDYILCGETVVEDERDNTLAECTTGVVNTDNAHLCMSGLLESYRGVVFESSLIDSDDNCPNGENICVYQCDEGFHLTGDKATGKIGCYRNCDLPWGGTIRHNETVVAYNTGNVACSNDIYVFPRDTEMINQGQPLMTPLYTIVDITKNGIKYEKRAKNGKSYESCGNYDHKKTLICNNGVLELMDKNGKPIQNSSGLAQNYNLTGCNLYNYKCDTGVYKLTRNDIVNNKLDEPNDGNWDIADRSVLKGKRGRYTGCVDYDVSPNPTKNGESCTKAQYHYAFIRCQDHYKQDSDGVCRGQCSLTKKGGGLDRHDHGTTFTGFKDSSVPCPGSCTGVQLTCDDGSWKLNGGTVTGYYNYCGRAGNSCDGFDLKENELESGGVYSSCESYEDKTCTMTVKYKFDGCTGSYHQVPGTTDCAKNRQPMTCETTGKEKPPYSHYTNTTSGAYEIVWSGGKNDYVDEPENPCDWECDSGYRKNAEGTGCVKISDECGDTLSQKCKDPYAVVTGYSESDSGYNWDCGDRHCVLCKTGYYTGGTAENPVCEPEIFNACDNSHPYGCITGTNADTDNPDGNNITFTWNCPGLPNDDAHGGMGCSFSCPAGSSWNFDHKQCEANVCAPLPEDEGDVKWCSGATGQATTNNMNPTYDSKCEDPVACKYKCIQGFWRYNGVCTSTNPICGESLYSCNASFPVNTGSDESHYYRDCVDQDGSILTTVKCGLEKERGVCGKAVEGVCENIVVSSVGGCHSSIDCYDIPANEEIPECCLNMVRNSADCSSYTGETVCNNKKTWVPNFHRNMYVCSWNNYLTGHGACYCDGVECGDEYCNEDCLDYGIYYDELLGIDLTYPKPITYWYIDNPFSKYFNVIDTYTVYDTLLVSNVPLQCTNNWGQVDTGSITIVKPYKQSSVLFGFSSINELNEKLREGSFYSYKYNSGWVDHDHTYTGNCEEDAEACICGYKGGDKTVLYIYDYYNYGGFVRDCDPEHAKVEVEYGNTCSINNMAGLWMSTCTINYNQN